MLVMIIYILVGSFGFLTFFDEYSLRSFPEQILSAKYGHQNIPMIIASFAISITVISGAPLLFHPARDALFSMMWKGQEISKKKHLVVVTVMVFSSLGLALLVPGVVFVISLLGSLSNPIVRTMQICALPCCYYIKLFPGKWTRRDLLLAWSCIGVLTIFGTGGFIIFVLGLAGVV
jgi:hypothetical protein